MSWKDLFYFRRESKIAVILLLILIILTLILNFLLSRKKFSTEILQQNDSIVREFEMFSQRLRERKTEIKSDDPDLLNSGRDLPAVTAPVAAGESVSESADFRKSSSQFYAGIKKLSPGETISLNETDRAEWEKIPGIGAVYSTRILKYRDLLGGFVRVEQLREVYGIDNELYERIVHYIEPNIHLNKLHINSVEFAELLRHPYLNYKQVKRIVNLRQRKGRISSLKELAMLDEFTSEDIFRLEPYIEF